MPDNKVHSSFRSSYYYLFVITFTSIFINADRSLMTLLLNDIKHDMALTDSEIGFIYGTAISIFYALFSIPLGKLADVWNRKKIIAIGLGFCSVMILFTGMAKNFATLALFRIGVGAGESSIGPAGMSIIADYFSSERRASAMSILSCGVMVGAGAGVIGGGYLLEAWYNAYPQASQAPFGIKGWQMVLLVMGVIGLLLALWSYSIKEPVRGGIDGKAVTPNKAPFKTTWQVLLTMIPALSLYRLYQLGGKPAVIRNVKVLVILLATALILIQLTGSVAQWCSLAFGAYCVMGWVQNFKVTDSAGYRIIFLNKPLMLIFFGLSCFVFVFASVMTWIAPFFQRVHGVGFADLGTILGVTAAVSGVIGTLSGGLLIDHAKRYVENAAIYLMLVSAVLVGPLLYLMLHTEVLARAVVFYGLFIAFTSIWYGVIAAIIADRVTPEYRGITSAFYLIMITFIGFAMGPYFVGFASDLLVARGESSADSLRQGLSYSLFALFGAFVLLYMALHSSTRGGGSQSVASETDVGDSQSPAVTAVKEYP